ncbi:RES family NAD+ phosphorylase [Intrasporangium sp.]|uniref:RES family NAD+ phosphorylase n=1 Tax=Intrasporangium sp. TaxID=1925024 RepID=UPI0032221E6D
MTVTDGDIRPTTELLWRIHKTSGPHPSRWDEYRTHGPLTKMRWDPHPLPVGLHADCGVIYASTDLRTAVAEVFQSTKRIDPYTGDPHVTTFVPRVPLRLLELYSDDAAWLLRHDASHSLMHGPRSTCRNWARAILEAYRIDGLWVQSTMTGRATTVLFSPSATKLPARPRATAPLTASTVLKALDDIATSFGRGWRFAAPGFRGR